MTETIEKRKVDHLDLCTREEVEFRLKTTLLEEVDLLHCALPELSADEIDVSCALLGRVLRAPLVITGMTGGAPEAREINRTLARLAQQQGIAFGVGSQRAMLVDPGCADTYAVRDVAPDVLLLGNIGVVQARDTPSRALQDLVDAIGADALCVHLNPGQELIQEAGDRDFRGGLDTLARLVDDLTVPIVAKETGCGLSPSVVRAAMASGVDVFDVSGAGGTTWVGVEALRARTGRRALGEDFWEWGIPTAAAIMGAAGQGPTLIASGGVRSGHDAARAIALGAHAVGMALPVLRALRAGGVDAAAATLERVVDGLRVAMLLTGSRNLAALQQAPRLVGPTLERWSRALGTGAGRPAPP